MHCVTWWSVSINTTPKFLSAGLIFMDCLATCSLWRDACSGPDSLGFLLRTNHVKIICNVLFCIIYIHF